MTLEENSDIEAEENITSRFADRLTFDSNEILLIKMIINF